MWSMIYNKPGVQVWRLRSSVIIKLLILKSLSYLLEARGYYFMLVFPLNKVEKMLVMGKCLRIQGSIIHKILVSKANSWLFINKLNFYESVIKEISSSILATNNSKNWQSLNFSSIKHTINICEILVISQWEMNSKVCFH